MFRYGNHHRVKSIRTPSRVISNNIDPYDSSSSLTAAEADGAAEDSTTLESPAALPSPRPLRSNLLKHFYQTHIFSKNVLFFRIV